MINCKTERPLSVINRPTRSHDSYLCNSVHRQTDTCKTTTSWPGGQRVITILSHSSRGSRGNIAKWRALKMLSGLGYGDECPLPSWLGVLGSIMSSASWVWGGARPEMHSGVFWRSKIGPNCTYMLMLWVRWTVLSECVGFNVSFDT